MCNPGSADAGASEFDDSFPVPTIRFANWNRFGFIRKGLSLMAAVSRTGFTLLHVRPDLFIAGPMALAWHLLSGRPY